MKAKSLDEVVKRIARENPGMVKKSLARAVALLSGEPPASGAETSTFPPVRRGPVPEVAMKLRVHFGRAQQAAEATTQKAPRTLRASKRRKLLSGFTQQELDQLLSIEPVLLKWMAADKERAVRFFADPVGALELAGIKLPPALLRKIRQQRSRSLDLAPHAQLPRSRIESIDVDVQR